MSDGDVRSWCSSARRVDAAKPGGGSDAVVAVRSWPTLPAAVHGEDAGHRGDLHGRQQKDARGMQARPKGRRRRLCRRRARRVQMASGGGLLAAATRDVMGDALA